MDTSLWHVKPKQGGLPEFDESYFEWVQVLEAVDCAVQKFVMVELGSGYGTWLAIAEVALRQKSNIPSLLVAVEAEPTRFKFIRQHFQDNRIDSSQHLLVNAAVGGKGHRGAAWFQVGDPTRTYGASIQPEGSLSTAQESPTMKLRKAVKRLLDRVAGKHYLKKVPVVTLSDLLCQTGIVDLLDMDIQGAELEVVQDSKDQIDRMVKRVHIGTHSKEVESGLRKIFQSMNWKKVNDYSCRSVAETAYGQIAFQDGVQTWHNPLFCEV